MHEQIKETELEFCEFYSDPTAMTECLIPENINLPQSWPVCNCITLRPYQFAIQNYSYLIAYDDALSQLQNLELKKLAGNLYSIAGRNLGKSLWVWIDTLLTTIHQVKEACVASFDDLHLKKITNVIAMYVESHKFLQVFHLSKETSRSKTVKRSPFEIVTEHGSIVKGVNEKVESDNPGVAFHGMHFNYLNFEEFSYSSDAGAKKRVDSGNSLGYIERLSGIPDLCIGSPMGKVLKNQKNQNWIWRLPQYVREDYTQEVHEKLADEHNGEQSASFRLNVEAITLEGAYGFWDMARLKEASFKKNKRIKHFEIGKDNFEDFKNRIHVERLSGSEQVFIMADVGFNAAPTEIIIIFFDGKKYTYSYNITLYRLLRKEQAQIFYWLYQKLQGSFIGIDASVHPDEFVFVKVDGSLKYIRFKDVEQFKTCLLEVPTYKNNKLEWKKASLFKHDFKGRIGEVIVSPGNSSVKVTDNHSVMIYKNGGIKKQFLKDCKVGDWMLCPKNYKITNDKSILLKYLKVKKNRFTPDEYQDIFLDKKLAYFLGWCCAEGSSKTTNYQLSLGNEKKDAKELLQISQELFQLKSGRVIKRTKKQQNNKLSFIGNRQIKATQSKYEVCLGGGKGLLQFIENLVGKGSHNKQIPECIFNASKQIQKAFIKGFTKGDGHIRKTLEKTVKVNYGCASEELIKGLSCLYNMLGIYTTYTIYKDKTTGFTSYKLDCHIDKKMNKWDGVPLEILGLNRKGQPKCKIISEKSLKRYTSDLNVIKEFQKLRVGDWSFRKIKEILYTDYDGDVYDFVVEDNHTFVAGNGNILVHNTSDDGVILDYVYEMGIPKSNLIKVKFNSNIEIGFQKDVEDNIVVDNSGVPLMQLENARQFAFQELEKLLYGGNMEIPFCEKFLTQFTSTIAKQTKGMKMMYENKSSADHLHSAFEVFGVCRFLKEFEQVRGTIQTKRAFYSK